MRTLYDVLGVSRSATASQIEAAYRSAIDGLAGGADGSDELLRAKAVGEAWRVLGTEHRRDAYDARLRHKDQDTVHLIVVQKTSHWPAILALAALLIGGAVWYKVQVRRVAAEQTAFEAMRAQADATAAARQAEAEDSRLARQVLDERRRAEEQRAYEVALARRDSARPSAYYEADAGPSADRRRELATARVKAEQRQEEHLARLRSFEQTIAMQRALAIPILKH